MHIQDRLMVLFA